MRNVGLDVVRFVAVLLVIFCHIRDAPPLPPAALRPLQSGGGIGVILFFVMSGFLVSSLIFAEHARSGTVNASRFLGRRAFKLFPPYWCVLAAALLVGASRTSAPTASVSWKEVAVRAALVQNYFPQYFNHTWTLAVEADFYLLVAVITAGLMALRAQHPFGTVPVICLTGMLACGVARWIEAPRLGNDPQLWAPSYLQIAPLCFGVLLAHLVAFARLDARLTRVPAWLLVASGGLGMVGPACCERLVTHLSLPGSPIGYPVTYAGAGLIVLGARRLNVSESRAVRFCATLGAMSYSTYLWHGLVNIAAWRLPAGLLGEWWRIAYAPLYVVGAFVVGAVMYRLIEQPSMAVRDRVFPKAIPSSFRAFARRDTSGHCAVPYHSDCNPLLPAPERR